jgi:hypothetical protein
VVWNGHAEKSRGIQVFLNRLVWENGYTQVVNSVTQGGALLDVSLVWPKSVFTSCSNVQGISDRCGVLLEADWRENCSEHQVKILVSVYHKKKSQVYKVSSGVNPHHAHVMVVAYRKFGKVLRKWSSRVRIVLYHINL